MLWNGAFRCKGQKARSHFDWLQADEFKRLDERPFGERQFVVEEIPVCAANIADIGLEDKQTSARSEAAAGDAVTLRCPRPLNGPGKGSASANGTRSGKRAVGATRTNRPATVEKRSAPCPQTWLD